MTTTTAWLLLCAGWAGALAGLRSGITGTAMVPVTVVVLLATAGLALRWGRAKAGARADAGIDARRGPAVYVALLCLPVVLVTMTGAAIRSDAVRDGPAARLAGEGRAVDATLVVLTDVRAPPEHGRGWVLARLRTVAATGHPPHRSRERVLLRVPDEDAPVVGGRYRLTARSRLLPPGPVADHFASVGVTASLDPVGLDPIAPPPTWLAATTWLRDRFATATHDRLAQDRAALMTGLLTGDTEGQHDEVTDAMLAAGLSHLVAVSGANVALVIGGVLGLAAITRAGRRTGWWVSVVVVWWYAVLVRLEPSVVRASIMATLVLGAMLVGRIRSTPSLVAITGLLALLADPMLAGRLGFVLSMAATTGIVLLTPAIDRWMDRTTRVPRGPRLILAATCGAQVAVTPVLVGIGGVIHPASVPANLVAVPAAAIAKVLGIAVALLGTVAPAAAAHLATVAWLPLSVVLWSARTFGGRSGQRSVELLALVVLTGTVWSARRRWTRRPRTTAVGAQAGRGLLVTVRRAAPALGLVVVLLIAGLPGDPSSGGRSPDVPVLVALDVGQGDALLLGDPTAGWLLVDGGPDPRVLAEALAGVGVHSLAAVVATHPHADHTAGLAHPLTDLQVGALVLGPRGEEDVALVAAATTGEVPVVQVAAGDRWRHGAIELTVLSPPATGLGTDPNDNSLVIRADVHDGRSALLTGDAELLAQTLLMRDPRIDVEILKVPHHGGNTNAPGFLAATSPHQALITVGAENAFGHPHPDVIDDLGGRPGVEILRTDLDGTVTVRLRSP